MDLDAVGGGERGGLGKGVLDFGGDRRREGAVWGEYNAEMAY